MTTQLVGGQRDWRMTQDREGNREYKLKMLVKADTTDGPYAVSQTAGLPLPGTYWIVDDDQDLWATCKLDSTYSPRLTDEPNQFWDCEFRFATKADDKQCKDESITDPLQIPTRISGSFSKYQEEGVYDRAGDPITNSAHEQIRGAQNEWDKNRPSVKIEMNVPLLNLGLVMPMIDTLNQYPLWGLPPRTIKLSHFSWEKKYYGQCYVYYTWNFEFDIRFETFDRNLLDEGTKVLGGAGSHWDTQTNGAWIPAPIKGYTGSPNPDPKNPSHFMRAVDRLNNPFKVVLDGTGKPAFTMTNPRFLCIKNNTNVPLTDATTWIPPVGTSAEWQPTTNYVPGNIVYDEDPTAPSGVWTYIAVVANVNEDPPLNSDPANPFSSWVKAGVFDSSGLIRQTGIWLPNSAYYVGDEATDPNTLSQAGTIHVEKYDESNFLLLGIPVNF